MPSVPEKIKGGVHGLPLFSLTEVIMLGMLVPAPLIYLERM